MSACSSIKTNVYLRHTKIHLILCRD